jgi:hypothetical protein
VISAEREAAIAFATSEIYPASENATKPRRVARFEIYDERGRAQAVRKIAAEELELVGRVRAQAAPRLAAIALNPHFIELEAEKFESYLEEEGDRAAIASRAERGEKAAPGREYYTKFAKVLFPGTNRRGAAKLAGHTLELVPVDDLFAPVERGELRVRVLFRGAPLAGAEVALGREGLGEHGYVARAVSDAAGEVRIAAVMPGLHFLRAHVMERRDARARDGRPPAIDGKPAPDADWQSFWASLAFAVAADPKTEEIIARVRATHGRAGPWAVLGYRMGERALEELGLERDSPSLEVVHESPQKAQYTCIADGVQAGAGVSAGRLNLKLVEVAAEKLRTTFIRKATGQKISMKPSDAFVQSTKDLAPRDFDAAARRVAAAPVGELVTIEVGPN